MCAELSMIFKGVMLITVNRCKLTLYICLPAAAALSVVVRVVIEASVVIDDRAVSIESVVVAVVLCVVLGVVTAVVLNVVVVKVSSVVFCVDVTLAVVTTCIVEETVVLMVGVVLHDGNW